MDSSSIGVLLTEFKKSFCRLEALRQRAQFLPFLSIPQKMSSCENYTTIPPNPEKSPTFLDIRSSKVMIGFTAFVAAFTVRVREHSKTLGAKLRTEIHRTASCILL